MAAHVPRRRCVGCGRVASKPELVRLAIGSVEHESRPVAMLDLTATMGGRGAYLCQARDGVTPARDCMKRANTRGALQRAFRVAVSVPAEFVESESRYE